MKEAMDAGRNNPDLAVQEKWAGFEYAGDEPTLEEFILWMAEQIRGSEIRDRSEGLFLLAFLRLFAYNVR